MVGFLVVVGEAWGVAGIGFWEPALWVEGVWGGEVAGGVEGGFGGDADAGLEACQ